MLTVTDRRAFGSILLASYLPCAYRTDPEKRRTPSAEEAVSWESFEEITNGVWRPAPYVDERRPGSGTTCGFLTGWFLWRIGCKDRNVVNRTCAAADGSPIGRYSAGHNICAVRGACGGNGDADKRRHAHYVRVHGDPANTAAFASGALRPKLGDVVHVNTKPGTNKDHVLIFLNAFQDADGTERWQTAEAGGPTPEYAGQQMKAPFWREQAVFSSRRTVAPGPGAIRLLSREPGRSSPVTDTRSLMGWVDLDRIRDWGPLVLNPARRSSVPGYPPPVKLPNGQTLPWSALEAGAGMIGALLPGLGAGGLAPPTPAPPELPAPGTITLPGGFTIPNPFVLG